MRRISTPPPHRHLLGRLLAISCLIAALVLPASARAEAGCKIDTFEGTCGGGDALNAVEPSTAGEPFAGVSCDELKDDLPPQAIETAAAPVEAKQRPVTLQLFHSHNCPHCREALAWFPELKAQFPNLHIEDYEILKSDENRAKFQARARELGVTIRGVPMFFIGGETVVGFSRETTPRQIVELVSAQSKPVEVKAAALKDGGKRPTVTMQMFYDASGCAHCQGAMEWLPELTTAYPNLVVEKIAVNDSEANRARFVETAKKFGTEPQGLPAFFIGDDVFYGFYKDKTCAGLIDKVRELSGIAEDEACASEREISVPFLGSIRTDRVSIGQLTLVLGLLDSLNPCAIWVLTFLLSLLAHTRSRKKMLVVGGTFVLMSGFIYFAFMAAWLSLFNVIGMHKAITVILGLVAVAMGLINLKELFFFKKGVSLMIPDSAKPKIATRARKILNEKNMALAVVGTAVLAAFANVVELGCTVGLPAIFTKVLSSRGISPAGQIGYMALYNVYYVIPLALIVGLFAWTMGHFRVTEKTGKALKLISGAVMLTLGVIMLFKPSLLVLG